MLSRGDLYYKRLDAVSIRKKLARWYERSRRDLPWRRTSDPYAIWISEIMLQQTRVAAVIPYYEKFLKRFPDAASLACAPEDEVLTLWSGLGYYSRARNLRKAAREIASRGDFPPDYESIRELPGVGDYTAAAIASIAFGLPHAVVDGNVKRVIARLMNNGAASPGDIARKLLDVHNPARSNQALMELGALVCLPRVPLCQECPIARHCAAHRAGTQLDVPVKRLKPATVRLERTLLVIRKRGRILLAPGTRVRGFWDLPEPFEGARLVREAGEFSHSILNRRYKFVVWEATTPRAPKGMRWMDDTRLNEIPLSTAAKKALRCSKDQKSVS
jgi:A/G-specific adenine glycosylase